MKEYIISQMTTDEQEKWFIILNDLQPKVSKPSFETWLQHSIILVNEEQKSVHVFSANDFAVDWIRNQYRELIIVSIKDVLGIEILHFECRLYDDFETR